MRDQRRRSDSSLLHNHPSGDPKPSRDDIEMTKDIKKAAEPLGIAIHDHLVIGRKGHASFWSLGLLCQRSGGLDCERGLIRKPYAIFDWEHCCQSRNARSHSIFDEAIANSRAARTCPSFFASESINRTFPDTRQRHG